MNQSKHERLRVVYAGTPAFATHPLQALIDSDFCSVIAVYSQPDRRSGRGKKLLPSPVKSLALDNGIAVIQPTNFKSPEDVQALAALDADVMVVAAYGLILPESVLTLPRLGCLNIHASLLPRWRGAAPVERAIAEGDSETGITIMQMDAGLDTGNILLKKPYGIRADDTGDSVREKLALLGGGALIEVLSTFLTDTVKGEVQDDTKANYAAKITKEECALDWQRPAEHLERSIRAFYSSYTSYSFLNDQRLKIGAARVVYEHNASSSETPGTLMAVSKESIDVACGQHRLQLTQLQLPGSRMMSVKDIMNSRADLFPLGTVFSSNAK